MSHFDYFFAYFTSFSEVKITECFCALRSKTISNTSIKTSWGDHRITNHVRHLGNDLPLGFPSYR